MGIITHSSLTFRLWNKLICAYHFVNQKAYSQEFYSEIQSLWTFISFASKRLPIHDDSLLLSLWFNVVHLSSQFNSITRLMSDDKWRHNLKDIIQELQWWSRVRNQNVTDRSCSNINVEANSKISAMVQSYAQKLVM